LSWGIHLVPEVLNLILTSVLASIKRLYTTEEDLLASNFMSEKWRFFVASENDTNHLEIQILL